MERLDGQVHENWQGLNDTILEYGKAAISKSFYQQLECLARTSWKHWSHFFYQEPGSSCIYRVYRLSTRYFMELQCAKSHCKQHGLIVQFDKDAGGYRASYIGTAAGQATPAQVVTIQRLDEIFTALGPQIAIQGFFDPISPSFKLVEENESEFDGIPMLYELDEVSDPSK
jgi:hypothetical protein